MAISPIVRPTERTLLFKKTSAIEQASGSSGWQSLHALDFTPDSGSNLVDENEMGGEKHNPVDPTQQVEGLKNPSWAGNFVLDLNQIGHWLLSLYGSVTSEEDGETGVYDHVFTSGGAGPGLFHTETRHASGLFTFGDSLAVSQMSFNYSKEDGSRKISMTGVGASVRTPVNAAIAVTPTAAPTRAKVPGARGLQKINGVAFGNIVGGNFAMSTGAFGERYFDDADGFGAMEFGVPSFTGSPEIRFRRDAYAMLASFDGKTPFTSEILYKLTDDLLLSLELANVIANPTEPKPSGANAMSVSPTFMSSQTGAAPMVTATLRNAIASY